MYNAEITFVNEEVRYANFMIVDDVPKDSSIVAFSILLVSIRTQMLLAQRYHKDNPLGDCQCLLHLSSIIHDNV
jgi:hypothetical protein